MRYAVPVTDGRLAAHFGHCQQFAVFDADEANKTIQKKDIIDSPGHEPGLLPMWLAEHGVSAVIAGGMGSRAQDLFRENHIRVIVGAAESDPEEAVLKYLNGTLATGDNICDH